MVVHAPLRRAVLAGLLVLVGLGSVVATDQASASRDHLAVPDVHVGDHGMFVASLEYADGTPTAPRAGHWTNMTFAWQQGSARVDLDGVLHAVRVLETYTNATQGAGWTSSWARWSTDATTAQTVAVDLKWYSSGSSIARAVSGGWTTVGNTTRFNEGAVLCGMRSSLQGTAGSPPETAWLEGGCGESAGLGAGGKTLFRLEGPEVVAGRQAYRYAAADGAPVRVWFSSGLAAPIQVVQPSVADGEVRGILQRLTLVGWEPGTEAESLPALPRSTSTRPLEWVPRERWGPSGWPEGHPFPHTQAWELALSDPTSGLASFVADHPEAYLMFLHSAAGTHNGLPSFSWTFIVTDGIASHGVSVTAMDSPTPMVALPEALRYDVGTFATETNSLWLPDPEQVPDAPYPAYGSLLDRWSVLRERSLPEAPVYGYGVWCQETGCGKLRSWAYAGESTEEFQLNATRNVGTSDMLLVEVPSRAATLSYEATQSQVAGLGPAPAPLGPGTDFGAPPERVTTLATQWIASPAGAGTFAAAILVAILTYVWPTLKQGAAGLFSRLEPEALASHPTRQAILDAVAASPGIHFQALCRTLGKGRGVVGHHLSKLVSGGQVTQHRKGGFTCYFLKSQGAQAVAGLAAVTALKAEGAQHLLRQLGATPERSGLELAEATGLSPSTVHYHLRRLQDAGLVIALPRGRSLAMRLTPAGERAASSATSPAAPRAEGNLA